MIETIQMGNELPKIKEEYHDISNEIIQLQKERDFYILDNKLLISKNSELNSEFNSLLSMIESKYNILQTTDIELSKKRQLLDTLNNSKEFNQFDTNLI